MKTPMNQRTVNVKMKRIDLCNAITAARFARDEIGESGYERWNNLYETLKAALADIDEKLEKEYE